MLVMPHVQQSVHTFYTSHLPSPPPLPNNSGPVWAGMTCNLHFKACQNLRPVYLMFQICPCMNLFMIKQNFERQDCAWMQHTFQANTSLALRQSYHVLQMHQTAWAWYSQARNSAGCGQSSPPLECQLTLFNTWTYGEGTDCS